MKLQEFAQLVRDMRQAQADYFRASASRSTDAREKLSRSKQLERMVAQAAADILDSQGRLDFGG